MRPAPELTEPLVGRETELTLLSAVLLHPDVRVLSLTGPAGIGKTSLALSLLSRVRLSFPGGVAFAGPTISGDRADLLRGIADALGVRTTTDATLIGTIATALGDSDRPVLLMLDDPSIDHQDINHLNQLLGRVTRLKLLATSHTALGVLDEREFVIPALSLPTSDESLALAAIEREAAVSLFVERAQAMQPGFALNLGNAVTVAEICRRLQGVPLAIEIAAARSRAFPPRALLARMEEQRGGKANPGRHQDVGFGSLDTLIVWAISTLDPEDQQSLISLSVFPDSFDASTARSVAHPEVDQQAIDQQLAVLVDARLLQRQGAREAQVRYAMPKPVYSLAENMFLTTDALNETRERHARAFADMAREAAAAFCTSGQRIWVTRLHTEIRNIRTALEWWYGSRMTDEALAMATNLSRFWASRTRLSEGRAWLERGISDAAHVRDETLVAARDTTSWLLLLQGDADGSKDLVEANLDLYRSTGNGRGVATTLDSLGELALSRGAFDDAIKCFSESLALWLPENADWNVAMTRISLGCATLNLGQIDEASALFALARSELSRLGDRRAANVALVAEAWMHIHSGALPDAERELLTALRTFRELGVVLETAEALEGLSVIAHLADDSQRACELLVATLVLRRENGIHPAFISRLGCLAERSAVRSLLMTSLTADDYRVTRDSAEQLVESLVTVG